MTRVKLVLPEPPAPPTPLEEGIARLRHFWEGLTAENQALLVLWLVAGFVAVAAVRRHRARRRAGRAPVRHRPVRRQAETANDDNAVVLRLNGIAVRLIELFNNVLILGSSGSGKTSGSIKTIVKSLLKLPCKPAFVFACVKRTDADQYVSWVRECGQGHRVRIFRPDGDMRVNLLSLLLEMMQTVEATVQFLNVLSTINTEPQERGESERFWPAAAAEMLRCCIYLLGYAGESLTITNLHRLVQALPAGLSVVAAPNWPENYAAQLVARARANGSLKDQHAVNRDVACNYVARVFPSMGDRTAGSVKAVGMNTLAPFISPWAVPLFSAEQPTWHPREVYEGQGQIVVIDTPTLVYGLSGTVMNFVVKALAEEELLRREIKTHPLPVFIVEDELSQLVHAGHSEKVLSVSRSQRFGHIGAVQSFSQLLTGFGGQQQEAACMAYAANCNIKFIHCQTDAYTNQKICELMGREKQVFASGGNSRVGGDEGDWFPSGGGMQWNWSEQLTEVLQPSEMLKLRTGTAANNFEVDALMIVGGRVFGGKPFARVTFDQRF